MLPGPFFKFQGFFIRIDAFIVDRKVGIAKKPYRPRKVLIIVAENVPGD
jgi:hypothetical protein